jgi:hypothetical protein
LGINYLDVAAEQAAVLSVFERFSHAAREAAVVIAPAMAFYGGWEISLRPQPWETGVPQMKIIIGIALDSWKPTRGTSDKRTAILDAKQHETVQRYIGYGIEVNRRFCNHRAIPPILIDT